MSDAELDDVASELYSMDPSEFVAARTAAVSAAKDAGNKKRAAAIGKLRKPTVVGWMVNLLVREEPEDIADLFDLGDRLRSAQRHSTNRELRELSADRQKSVRALTARAVELAASRGHAANDNAAREVGQTLTAALADPDVAERVRAGRVVTAESYSGFGPAVLSVAPEPEVDDDEHAADATAEEDVSPDDDALVDARRDLDDAREDEEAARAAADTARSEAAEAAARLSDVKKRLARLRAELHYAEAEETEARKAEKSTERESRRLQRVLDDAEARTAELAEVIAKLEK